MKPVAFDYERASDVAGAVKLLAAADGAARVIAGGQSLGPMLNLRLAQPQLLVDVRSIVELQHARLSGELGVGDLEERGQFLTAPAPVGLSSRVRRPCLALLVDLSMGWSS